MNWTLMPEATPENAAACDLTLQGGSNRVVTVDRSRPILLCIDDTWIDEEGRWTAKGTTAMPYLLENGFEVIEARDHAALLRRHVADTRRGAAQ